MQSSLREVPGSEKHGADGRPCACGHEASRVSEGADSIVGPPIFTLSEPARRTAPQQAFRRLGEMGQSRRSPCRILYEWDITGSIAFRPSAGCGTRLYCVLDRR